VLSEDELRKAVQANFVNQRIKEAFQSNHEWKYDSVVGINSSAQETNLQKLIEASYNNGKSFEENFGLNKILLNGRVQKEYETLKPSQLHEPFLAIVFEPRKNLNANVFISNNIKKIAFSDLTPELKGAAKEKMTWYNKLLGYGNHYFDFSSSFYIIGRECCDNRNSDDEDYLHRKEEAYYSSLRNVSDNVFQHKITDIRAVSNCGELLRSKHGGLAILGSKYDDGGNED
jgi:hypothetical protein